jgi:hypothetical protein
MTKIKKGKLVYNPKNFMGRGVSSPESGVSPNETGPMGDNYGLGMKNPMGKMRGDSIGYIPVTKDKLDKGFMPVV